jgi:catechol 2,3-dioxygenase-like lactoylglutathione lyase family enzyme
MAVHEVKVISVPVSDQERAKAFYVEKLGFELTRDDDSVPGLRWVQLAPKRGSTSLTLVNLVRDDAGGLPARARARLRGPGEGLR